MTGKVTRVSLKDTEKYLTGKLGGQVRIKGIKLKGETHIREGEELQKFMKEQK